MKALLLSTIVAALKAYVGSGLFTRIYELVVGLMNSEAPGQEKMQTVIDAIKREAFTVSTTLVRAVVEVILLKLKSQ